jgi:predicted Zn-dependent peptidase
MVQTYLMDNPFFYQSHAFKDQIIHVSFSYPKIEPNVTLANLLSYMMIDRTLKFPTKQSMSAEMDRLYGLSIHAKTSAFGTLHSFEFKLKTLSSHFLDDELQKDVFNFLEECIFYPLLDENSFNEAKINMRAALMRLQDQASIQGYRLAIDTISDKEAIKIYSQGSLEVLDRLRLDDLIQYTLALGS